MERLRLGSCVAAILLGGCGARQHDPSPDAGQSAGDASTVSGSDASTTDGPDAASRGRPDAGSKGIQATIRAGSVDKVDILFMIDNSTSMGDKQEILAAAVPDMINRLVSPNCVDASGHVLGPSANGNCSVGTVEFVPVHDMHLGIVSSSLGGRGGPLCDPTLPNSAAPALPSHNDDRGELLNRGGANESPVPHAQPFNFLAWFPPGAAQPGTTAPLSAETVTGDATTPGTLIGDFTQMITGVHEHGCGFEAQNEAWYRFLVQPDPYGSILVDSMSQRASYQGIDATILAQRKEFLRDDSMLVVVVVSDESQEVADPLAVGGQGWLVEQLPWPASTTGAAPEGSIECASNPFDPGCQTCAVVPPGPSFAARCPDDPPTGTQGYLDPGHDKINLRFFHQKQRFGIEAEYPSTRYVTGLTSPTVPDRNHEVDSAGSYIGDQSAQQNCVNPIFATNLPVDPTQDLCHLTRGPRTPDLVYYAFIGGVPHELLQAAPGDPECPMGTAAADCPQKGQLSVTDWRAITGNDPEHYDFTGANFHMLESETARPGAPCLPGQSTDNCDSINGREWDTQGGDLQFACTFDLPAPKDCTQMQYAGACDCALGEASQNSPLCQKDVNGNYTTTQIKGKAYPGLAELVVAHAMADQPTGVQGIVSSMCPIHTTPTSQTDPVYGYRPAANAIVNRLKNALEPECLATGLGPDATTGLVPCTILMTLAQPGDESVCNAPIQGLSVPASVLLSQVQNSRHSAWVASGGTASGQPDPNLFPTCALRQLEKGVDFPPSGSCSNSNEPGWCYVEGSAAMGCAQRLVFTPGEPMPGASLTLVCPAP